MRHQADQADAEQEYTTKREQETDMRNIKMRALAAGIAVFVVADPAWAVDAESCKKVRLSDVGWTDIQVTTSVTSTLLTALGYEPEITQLSVAVTLAALKDNDIDVFLGNWMPTQTDALKPYTDDGSIEVAGLNLEGAGFGPVVPDYVAAEGVKTLEDLEQECRKIRRQDLWHRVRFGRQQ